MNEIWKFTILVNIHVLILSVGAHMCMHVRHIVYLHAKRLSPHKIRLGT